MIRRAVASLGCLLALFAAPAAAEEGDAPALALSARAVPQGGVLRATISGAPGARGLKARVGDLPVAFLEEPGGLWAALVGVDLDVKPGPLPLTAEGTLASGKRFEVAATLDVLPGGFPVQKLTVDDKYQQFDKKTLDRINRENKRLNKIWRSVTRERLWDGPFAPPIAGEQGGGFGARREFNGVPKRPHSGVDVKAKEGTPFDAPARGRVVMAEDLYFSGNTVIVDHGGGLFTMFFHLSEFAVKAGDLVEKGARIGYVGKTGRVTGPHLHWGVKLNRARVDPNAVVRLTGGEGGEAS